MARIGKRIVDAAAPGDKDVFIWDDRLPGFGLKVHTTGIKSFVFQYRTAEGRTRRAVIAKVGALTPEQARQKAEAWSRLVKDGGDPLDQRQSAREAMTVAEILDHYLGSARFAAKAASTQSVDRGRIARHLKPLLGSAFGNRLTPEAVRRAMKDIEAGKTAKTVKTGKRGLARVRGGPMAARDSIALLRSALKQAVEDGLLASNPADSIRLPAIRQRETILSGPEDYGRLFQTLAALENARTIRAPAADAIRILALTGARKSEIACLKWGQVDMKGMRIILPPLAHKAGRRTGKDRVIALPSAAADIIARQPAGKPDDLVFKPAKGEGPIALTRPWRLVREAAKLPEGIGLHGLRHSLASFLAMGGAQAPEIRAALGHADLRMSARYIHFADAARSTLAERAAAPALAGMQAASGAKPAEVKKMGGAE